MAIVEFKRDLIMQGSGFQQWGIPSQYKFLSIINGTDNKIEVYANWITPADKAAAQTVITVPLFTMLTIPIFADTQYTFIYTDGGTAGSKTAQVIFSQVNLNINGVMGSPSAGGNVNISADSVGIARQAQLPAALSGRGFLKTSTLPEATATLTGNITAGTAAVQLPAQAILDGMAVIQAANANTGTVFVGGAASQDFELAAGQQFPFPASNLNVLYVRGSVAGQVVKWAVGV